MKKQKAVVGILAFEITKMMSKLVLLWRCPSDEEVDKLRQEISNSVDLKKLVSYDDDFILRYIPRELFEDLFTVAKYVAMLGKNHCSDPSLKDFEHAISNWIQSNVDPYGWQLSWESMESETKMMKDFISKNADLHHQMNRLSVLERTLKDLTAAVDKLDDPSMLWYQFQNKVKRKRRKVKNLKKVSVWNTTHDYVGILLARSVFTIASRIKHVYGLPKLITDAETRYSEHTNASTQSASNNTLLRLSPSIFSKHKLLLDAPPDALGDLALHYANIIIEINNLMFNTMKAQRDMRNELYSMLPSSIKAELRERLPGIKVYIESSDLLRQIPRLMDQSYREIYKIIEWLSPLARNIQYWHSHRKIQEKASVSRNPLFLVETLYFANHQKTDQTITDLLVHLHYKYTLLKSSEVCLRRHVSIKGDQTVK